MVLLRHGAGDDGGVKDQVLEGTLAAIVCGEAGVGRMALLGEIVIGQKRYFPI